jgi:hypothetical protein
MAFDLIPYVGSLPIRFGMTPAEVREALGEPDSVTSNRKGERDERRGETNVRYGSNNQNVVELAFGPHVPVLYKGVSLFEDPRALATLARDDPAPVEVLGFLLFLGLGIALTGVHDRDPNQLAISVFERGRWDHLQARFRPYSIE